MQFPKQGLTNIFVVAGGVLLFAVGLMAQIGGNGEIQGTVTDPSGAIVPQAAVVATNEATHVATTVHTTGKGFYVLSPLQPGDYTVTV
ncbi:MAG: carboxypeptidase-like regulatory domain-containing protein, partial [Bryobacteraceae bacterium]